MSLVQTIGRVARNVHGRAILYADRITKSMQQAMEETERRREKQRRFNEDHGITPATIYKSVTDILQTAIPGSGLAIPSTQKRVAEPAASYSKPLTPKQLAKKIKQMEEAMYKHAKDLEFEQAAKIRDELKLLQEQVLV